MLYKPDHNLAKARKFIEEMPESEAKEHVDYLIKHLNDHIEKQSKKLNEYNDFFEKLNRFLPNRNVVYGGR